MDYKKALDVVDDTGTPIRSTLLNWETTCIGKDLEIDKWKAIAERLAVALEVILDGPCDCPDDGGTWEIEDHCTVCPRLRAWVALKRHKALTASRVDRE